MSILLKLELRNILLKLLISEVNDKENVNPLTKDTLELIKMIFSSCKDLMNVLKVYGEIIENETHPLLKESQLSGLNKFRLNSFPQIVQFLLDYWEPLKETGCDQFAIKAIGYAKMLLEPLMSNAREKLSISKHEETLLNNLIMALNIALEQLDSIKNQHFLNETREKSLLHPLDVEYGNRNRPYSVPFPNFEIMDSLRGLKKSDKVDPNKNLSAHFITIVYSPPKAWDGTKRTKRTLHIPCNPPRDLFTAIHFSGKPMIDFFSRKTRGFKIYQDKINKDHLFPILEKNELAKKPDEERALLHSEQTFFKYLKDNMASKLLNDLKKYDKNFITGCKVYMVAFDIGSSFDSCINCRLAALSVQSGNRNKDDFLGIFQQILLENKYELPKEKAGLRLKGVTRILAETQRNVVNIHKNPCEKNVKYLENVGVFQVVMPNVFCSGNVLKTYEK